MSSRMENIPEDSPTDMSVLLQFAKFSKGFRISDFDKFVESIGVENFNFFGRLAYPNQWQIRLTNVDIRERLIRTGKTRIKNRSCWMYPLNQQEIRGFVYWMPNSITNDQLKEHLLLYGNVLFVESQERTVKGRQIESDPRYYGLILPYGTVKEDLPHFLKINGFLCFLVVRGREPACFHCKEAGHRRIECPKYKAKLTDYCNRLPNTARPRLKPRGRRHKKVEIEGIDETGGNKVSSSGDIVCLESGLPVDEVTTGLNLLSVSKDQEQVIENQGEATGSTEKELVESNFPGERKEQFCIDPSFASSSETNTQTLDILETIRQIQTKARRDLQQRLKSFEEEITLAFTREAYPISRNQNQSAETVDTCMNLVEFTEGIKITETPSKGIVTDTAKLSEDQGHELLAMLERTKDLSEESLKRLETDIYSQMRGQKNARLTEEDLCFAKQMLEQDLEEQKKGINTQEKLATPDEMPKDFNVDTSIDETKGIEVRLDVPMIHQAEIDAEETVEEVYKKMEEKTKDLQSAELSVEYSTSNIHKISSVILMLQETEQAASNILEKTFKNLVEFTDGIKITERPSNDITTDTAKLSEDQGHELLAMLERAKEDFSDETLKRLEADVYSQMSGQKDAELTEDDLCFAKQMLENSKEKATEILKNTFKNLREKVVKSAKPSQTITESVNESKPFPKIKRITKQPDATSEQLKDDAVDTENHACKEDKKVVVETENTCIYDKSAVETVQTESDPITTQGNFEATEFCEPGVKNRIVPTIQKAFSGKDKSNIPATVQKGIDILKMNLKEIFASVLNESELPPETRRLLEQVESEVITVAGKTKTILKKDIEEVLASF